MFRKKGLHIAWIIITIFFFLLCYKTYWNDLPRGVHQWAAADRYAVAMRFVEDDRPIHKPATLYMKSIDGDVGCELPLQAYLIALAVKAGIPASYMPFAFRMFNLLLLSISLCTLLFFLLREEWFIIKIASVILLFSSPLLVFYAFNFLPDIFALSLILFSFYLFERNFEKYMVYILLLLGLATMVKTLAGVYLIAVMGIYLLKHFKSLNVKRIGILGLGTIILGGIAYYDKTHVIERNKALWSPVFMSASRPVNSISEFFDFLERTSRFRFEYLSLPQWIVLLITLIIVIRKWKKWMPQYRHLLFLLLIGFVGIFALFGIQFVHHDYYVLSSFIPAIILLCGKGIAHMAKRVPPQSFAIVISILAIASFSLASDRNFDRISQHFDIEGGVERYMRDWLVGIDEKVAPYMQSEDEVAILYVNEPNLSLVYANRKGLTFNEEEMGREEENPFLYWMNRNKTSFFICKNENLTKLESHQPNYLSNSKLIKSFEEFSLYQHGH